MEGIIEEAVQGIFTGQDIRHLMCSSQIHACGTGCTGTGGGFG